MYPDYTQSVFEAELGKRFRVLEKVGLPGNTRMLYTFSR